MQCVNARCVNARRDYNVYERQFQLKNHYAVITAKLEVSVHKLLNRCAFKLAAPSANSCFADTQYKTVDGLFAADDVIGGL